VKVLEGDKLIISPSLIKLIHLPYYYWVILIKNIIRMVYAKVTVILDNLLQEA